MFAGQAPPPQQGTAHIGPSPTLKMLRSQPELQTLAARAKLRVQSTQTSRAKQLLELNQRMDTLSLWSAGQVARSLPNRRLRLDNRVS